MNGNMPQKIKMLLRRLIANAYYVSGNYLNRLNGKVLILAYHRVLSDAELDEYYVQPGMYVHKDVFEEHMRFLKSNFVILSFHALLELWDKKAVEEDKRYCVITFDDGWLDNYTYAYPILKKYGVPATIFLATSFIGTDEWFWPEKVIYVLSHCESQAERDRIFNKLDIYESDIDKIIEGCKRLREEDLKILINELESCFEFPRKRMLLNWDEVKEMSANSISFGSHSHTHKILTRYPVDIVKQDVRRSKNMLMGKSINFIPVFCYPNGNNCREVVEIVETEEFTAAITTASGSEGKEPSSRFTLRRIGIHDDISSSIPLFAYHITHNA